MKKPPALSAGAILCGAALFMCSCAIDRIVGGGSIRDLSRRSSLPKERIVHINAVVEARLSHGSVFWDGPYSAVEAAQVGRISDQNRDAFATFAASHPEDRFFVCFEFLVLDGFPKGQAEGYSPTSVLAFGDDEIADWFEDGAK